jgi:hypothetical protein
MKEKMHAKFKKKAKASPSPKSVEKQTGGASKLAGAVTDIMKLN